MELSELEHKILQGMSQEALYAMSDLGYIAFGRFRKNLESEKIYRTSQGSALAAGRHVRKLIDKGFIKHEVRMMNIGLTGYKKTFKGEELVPFQPKEQ